MTQHLMLILFSLTVSSLASAKSLVVISGGYQSCSKNGDFVRLPHVPLIATIISSATPVIQGLKNLGDDVEVLWSCYSGVKRRPLGDMLGLSPMAFSYGSATPEDGGRAIHVSSNTIEDAKPLTPFFQFVEQYASVKKPDHIYIAGHSYGGWTSMHLGVQLVKSGYHVSAITTFDPISPFQCPAGILSSAIVLGSPVPAGCLTAPRDLADDEVDLLRQDQSILINFYQTTFSRLHASVLKYPGWSNRLVEQDYNQVWFGDTHTSMIKIVDLWREWFQQIQLSRH